MKKSGIILVPQNELSAFIQYINVNHSPEEKVRVISRFDDTVAAIIIQPNLSVFIDEYECYLDAYRFHHGFDVEGYYHDETDAEKFNEDTFNEFDERKLALINHESGMLEIVEFDNATTLLQSHIPDAFYGVLGNFMKEIDIWHDDEYLLRGLPKTENPTLILKRDASRDFNDFNDLYDIVLYGNIVFASRNEDGDTIGLTEENFETLFERMVPVQVTHERTKMSESRLLFKCYKELYSI